MSRIGKQSLAVPPGVNLQVAGQVLTVAGKLGKQTLTLPPEVSAEVKDGKVTFKPLGDDKRARMMWGTQRALLGNILVGVVKGYVRNLEIEGVGFRAALDGKSLNLQLGYSHDIKYPIPEGIAIKVGEKQTTISISGHDKRQVGQVAAEIRGMRPPEPYKGKGIRYEGERILRKEGKKK